MALRPKITQKCWVWIAYDRDGKRVCGFELGKRNTATAQKLSNQLELFDVGIYCSDDYPAYRQAIPPEKHVITKAETCAIEGLNSRIRHYLARFHRKTFCVTHG